MKSNWCFTFILLAVYFLRLENSNAQSPQWQWAKSMGGTGNCRIYSMAIDPSGNGNLYLTGIFSGTVDFDPGADSFYLTSAGYMDIFILKLDDSGHFQWAKALGGTGYDIGTTIATDPGGSGDVYTTGYFEGTVDFDPGVGALNLSSAGDSDIFISKLDSAGSFVWALALGGTGTDNSFSIAVDPTGSGDIFTTGAFSETVDFDPGMETYTLTSLGYKDIFVSKIDGSGNFIWTKTIAGKKIDQGYSIAVDPGGSGDVYISGKFTGRVDFDPGPDSFNLTTIISPNIFISKLNESGQFEWAKAMSGTGGDYSNTSLAINPAGKGQVYTAGNFMGIVDFDPGADTFSFTADGFADIFISALDGSGHFEWAKAIGGSGADVCFSLAIDPSGSGDIYTTGLFEGTVDFDPGAGTFNLTAVGLDIFISKFNDRGNFVWAKSVTGASEDVGFSVALDAFGHVYVAGYFDSPSISLDSITLQNADSTGNRSNIFIAKLHAVTTPTVHVDSGIQQIRIYPNPVKDQLIIGINADPYDQMSITLFSVYGEIVFSDKIQYSRHEVPIDINVLPAGVYFVCVEIDGNKMVRKVVKE